MVEANIPSIPVAYASQLFDTKTSRIVNESMSRVDDLRTTVKVSANVAGMMKEFEGFRDHVRSAAKVSEMIAARKTLTSSFIANIQEVEARRQAIATGLKNVSNMFNVVKAMDEVSSIAKGLNSELLKHLRDAEEEGRLLLEKASSSDSTSKDFESESDEKSNRDWLRVLEWLELCLSIASSICSITGHAGASQSVEQNRIEYNIKEINVDIDIKINLPEMFEFGNLKSPEETDSAQPFDLDCD